MKQNLPCPRYIRRALLILPAIISAFLIAGCGDGRGKNESTASAPPADETFFQEISSQIGLDFVHSMGDNELTNIVESSSGGTAFLDFDKDGFIDIYVTSGTWVEGFSEGEKPAETPGNRLYRNNGNGTFSDVTKKSGTGGPWYSMGVSVGDYNNDGFPDIYISNYGPNVLLKNNGNGTFSDVTKKAGVAGLKECSVGAVWIDYDNDSWLDLYVGNYLTMDPDYKYFYAPDGFPGPLAYEAEKDYLFRNNGDGTFKDVTAEMGIIDLDGRTMGVGAADVNDDGFIDIYVANDKAMNYMWINNAGKGFTDKGTLSGTGFSQAGESTASMSVDFADYDNDGLMDLFVSDDNYCSLFKNQGEGVFSDVANPAGISMAAAQFVGWSSCFFDYDNDGDADIFKTNGALKHLYGHEDQLFENLGNGKFAENSVKLGPYFSDEYVGRGAALGDYDNDGDIDIFVVNLNDKCRFLRNNKGNSQNWITLDLEGTLSNRDGVGARIKITAGGKTQISQRRTTAGYLSQNDPRVHFGIGSSDTVETIEIRWPSGIVQTISSTKANQILKVTEPERSAK